MSETIIFMLGCATSRVAELDTGCVSMFWTTDGEGHRAALPVAMTARAPLGVIRCDGCGYEPDGEAQRGLARVLNEYLDLAQLAEQPPGMWVRSPCHVVIGQEEN